MERALGRRWIARADFARGAIQVGTIWCPAEFRGSGGTLVEIAWWRTEKTERRGSSGSGWSGYKGGVGRSLGVSPFNLVASRVPLKRRAEARRQKFVTNLR